MNQAQKTQHSRQRRIIIMVADDGTRVPWIFPHGWRGPDVLTWLRGTGLWVTALDLLDGKGPQPVPPKDD